MRRLAVVWGRGLTRRDRVRQAGHVADLLNGVADGLWDRRRVGGRARGGECGRETAQAEHESAGGDCGCSARKRGRSSWCCVAPHDRSLSPVRYPINEQKDRRLRQEGPRSGRSDIRADLALVRRTRQTVARTSYTASLTWPPAARTPAADTSRSRELR